MNSTYIIIGIIAVIFLAIIFYIKTTIDEKKGENSEEKKRVKEIVEKVTKDSEYKNIYATWEEFSIGGGGRTVTTTNIYTYYAVGFKPGSLYVIPLSFDGGDISYGEAMKFDKENIGMINAKEGKNWIEIYNLEKKPVVKLMVGPSETKEDKYHPVNISQKEEYKEFCNFISEFMREVNTYRNVEVTGKIGRPLQKK